MNIAGKFMEAAAGSWSFDDYSKTAKNGLSPDDYRVMLDMIDAAGHEAYSAASSIENEIMELCYEKARNNAE